MRRVGVTLAALAAAAPRGAAAQGTPQNDYLISFLSGASFSTTATSGSDSYDFTVSPFYDIVQATRGTTPVRYGLGVFDFSWSLGVDPGCGSARVPVMPYTRGSSTGCSAARRTTLYVHCNTAPFTQVEFIAESPVCVYAMRLLVDSSQCLSPLAQCQRPGTSPTPTRTATPSRGAPPSPTATPTPSRSWSSSPTASWTSAPSRTASRTASPLPPPYEMPAPERAGVGIGIAVAALAGGCCVWGMAVRWQRRWMAQAAGGLVSYEMPGGMAGSGAAAAAAALPPPKAPVHVGFGAASYGLGFPDARASPQGAAAGPAPPGVTVVRPPTAAAAAGAASPTGGSGAWSSASVDESAAYLAMGGPRTGGSDGLASSPGSVGGGGGGGGFARALDRSRQAAADRQRLFR